jgi:hypothetical protein
VSKEIAFSEFDIGIILKRGQHQFNPFIRDRKNSASRVRNGPDIKRTMRLKPSCEFRLSQV